MENREKKVLVIGVIGADVHAVGNKILYHAFTEAGFECVNLGVMVSQEEYIAAAIESDADAIVVSSLYGQGELDCRGLREKCDEAGLKGTAVGGAQVSEKHAGFIINRGGATSADVLSLIDLLRERIHDLHNIWIEPEIRTLSDCILP